MKRVYTDPRFPDYEVHNDGTNRFVVYELQRDGRFSEVDSFLSYAPSTPGQDEQVSEEVASSRARSYFERMAKGDMSTELSDRDDGPVDGDPLRSREPEPEVGKSVSLDDLMGGHVMSADDIMAAYEHAKKLTDPVQRERAMAQVREMSARMESSANELVRRLLD
jgi:hypothetical protein